MVNRIVALSLLAVLLVAAASPVAAQSGLSDGLIACWNMDEPSGPRADLVNYHHLTDINTVGYTAGKVGNAAYYISANNEQLNRSITSDPAMLPQTFTLSMWVYTPVGAGDDYYFGVSNSRHYVYYMSATNKIRWYVQNPPVGSNLVDSAAITPGEWYLITVWHDDTNNQIGLQIDDNAPVTASYSAGLSTGLTVFYFASAADFSQDETAYWNRVLSSDEIADYYNAGNGVSCADVLDDGGGGGGTVIAGPLGYTYDVDLPSGETGVVEMYATAGDLMNTAGIMGLGAVLSFYVIYRLAYASSRR